MTPKPEEKEGHKFYTAQELTAMLQSCGVLLITTADSTNTDYINLLTKVVPHLITDCLEYRVKISEAANKLTRIVT